MFPIMNAWYIAAGPRIGKKVIGSTIQTMKNVPATAAKAVHSCVPVTCTTPERTRESGAATDRSKAALPNSECG
jgi:hypothetical protein